jgi:hypothetical protein
VGTETEPGRHVQDVGGHEHKRNVIPGATDLLQGGRSGERRHEHVADNHVGVEIERCFHEVPASRDRRDDLEVALEKGD